MKRNSHHYYNYNIIHLIPVNSKSKFNYPIRLAFLMVLVCSYLMSEIHFIKSESVKPQLNSPIISNNKPNGPSINGSDPPTYIATGRKISKILDDFFYVSLIDFGYINHNLFLNNNLLTSIYFFIYLQPNKLIERL